MPGWIIRSLLLPPTLAWWPAPANGNDPDAEAGCVLRLGQPDPADGADRLNLLAPIGRRAAELASGPGGQGWQVRRPHAGRVPLVLRQAGREQVLEPGEAAPLLGAEELSFGGTTCAFEVEGGFQDGGLRLRGDRARGLDERGRAAVRDLLLLEVRLVLGDVRRPHIELPCLEERGWLWPEEGGLWLRRFSLRADLAQPPSPPERVGQSFRLGGVTWQVRPQQ